MRADLLAAPRSLSGVRCRQEGDHQHHVDALARTILRLAIEGNLATYCVVELLPLLQPHHWAAYAQEAQIPTPSAAVIADAMILYRLLIQYPDDATPTVELFRSF